MPIIGDVSRRIETILGSVHGFQLRFMKCHETVTTPVPNGASFWKRAGDMSKTGSLVYKGIQDSRKIQLTNVIVGTRLATVSRQAVSFLSVRDVHDFDPLENNEG